MKLKKMLLSKVGSKRSLNHSPAMEYRHNILTTGRVSTKPNSTFDQSERTSSLDKIASVINLPKIKGHKGRDEYLLPTKYGIRIIPKVSRKRNGVKKSKTRASMGVDHPRKFGGFDNLGSASELIRYESPQKQILNLNIPVKKRYKRNQGSVKTKKRIKGRIPQYLIKQYRFKI